ncbi:MAG: hypothetical protein U9R19_12035 [Bacteroidota bacterium]|nr:hypothetical protein [Bacteroidota bacterium]
MVYDYFSGAIAPGDTLIYTLLGAVYIDILIGPNFSIRLMSNYNQDFSNVALPVMLLEYYSNFTTLQQASISLYWSDNGGISFTPLHNLQLSTNENNHVLEIAMPELSNKSSVNSGFNLK